MKKITCPLQAWRALAAFTLLAGAGFPADTITIPVDSPAWVFSPGNWTGDAGRAGKVFRQTWNAYAYCRVAWESASSASQATLLLDTSGPARKYKPPFLAYAIDGIWRSQVPCTKDIVITDLDKAGKHQLTVCLTSSTQVERWGTDGASGANVLRITGLQVDAGSVPLPDAPKAAWALIIGDSITEGCGASELAPYAHLLGQALTARGYDYGISACGWSGWINKGDNPPGDVPGYYVVRDSINGAGGLYVDAESRWNKIDANRHSLLDAQGHISAYGATGQEPSLILINYGTNDALHHSNPSDTLASITQCLAALRASAPKAQIVLLIPFGQYYAKEIRQAVDAYHQSCPADRQVAIIDLGPAVARNLAGKGGVMGGLHPNDRGHALFAAQIIPALMPLLPPPSP